MQPSARRLVPLLLAAGVLASMTAACGSAQPSAAGGGRRTAGTAQAVSASASAAADRFPVTVRSGKGTLTITARPTHIVSLSPTATEMLFAIGAGSQVAAVDSDSDYPANAPHTKLSAYQPSAEAISNYSPDLVVLSNDMGGIVAALGKLRVPVLVQPAAQTLDDSYAEIQALGRATGHTAEATRVVDTMRSQIDAAVAEAPKPAQPTRYYYELDNTYYSVTSTTFIGSVLAKLGLVDIADKADKTGSGYPQLSPEYILSAKPDLILLADGKCCGQTPGKVAARPGWKQVPAVRDGHIIALDDDIASRWGPRIGQLAQQVATQLAAYQNK